MDAVNTKRSTTQPDTGIFGLELTFAAFIPFIVGWCITPTNILNSHFLFKLLELIGMMGMTLLFFAGIPIGIKGLRKARGMEKRRTATIILSLLNLSAGIMEVAALILIFCAVVVGGVSA